MIMLLAGAEGGYVFEDTIPTATNTATLVEPVPTPVNLLSGEKKELNGLNYWVFLVVIAILMAVSMISIFKKRK